MARLPVALTLLAASLTVAVLSAPLVSAKGHRRAGGHHSDDRPSPSLSANVSDVTLNSGPNRCFADTEQDARSNTAISNNAGPQPGGPPALSNRGGDVMSAPITVYYIWVGGWSDGQKAIVKNFVSSLTTRDSGATVPGWWSITKQYTGTDGKHVSGKVRSGAETSAPQQAFGSARAVADLVAQSISSGALPADGNGIYAVLGDTGTTQTGGSIENSQGTYCQQFCGWHASFGMNGGSYKFLFTANAAELCPTACISPPLTTGQVQPPNGDLGVDGMVSILAHEVAEAASDPYGNAWASQDGYENADLCQYKYGDIKTDGGVGYNLVGAKGSKYLIQQNWDQSKSSCQTTA